MQPIQVKVDLDDEENRTKAKVTWHEQDTAENDGRSAEVVVYVNRRGMRLPDISAAAVRAAEGFLRRILSGSGEKV